MVRRGRVADADAAAQQDRHLEPAAAHVLHLGDLVDDLADASRTKSANMKSITGRVPVMAAPHARPTKPRSQIGVSHSRSGPYWS